MMLAPPTVRVLAQQPMQHHAPTLATGASVEKWVAASGTEPLHQAGFTTAAGGSCSARCVGLNSDHHHRVLRVYGVQVRAPILSSM